MSEVNEVSKKIRRNKTNIYIYILAALASPGGFVMSSEIERPFCANGHAAIPMLLEKVDFLATRFYICPQCFVRKSLRIDFRGELKIKNLGIR